MSNLKQLPKPNSDITDYEWEITPPTVKATVESLQQRLQQKQHDLEHLEVENRWLRTQLDLKLDKFNQPTVPLLPEVLLWAAIGLILTIGGTFVPAYALAFPKFGQGTGIELQTLGVSFQIGAVLMIACLGGKNAALLSQIVYLGLGLGGLPIFGRGGGWEYLQEANFGYLLGFMLGAWLCGWLAFRSRAKLYSLILSCFVGLLVIHLTGICYLTILYLMTDWAAEINSWFQAVVLYSVYPLPGQLAVICATSSIAFVMRKIMFS